MSALERNPQVPAPTPHKVLGPGIDGRGITRGPLATRMITGLSCGRQRGSLNPRRNSRAPAETREYPGASPFQGSLFSWHCLDFQAGDRLTPRWHVGQPCGKASWESLVGKHRGKATDPLIHVKGSVTLLLQFGMKAHVHAPTRHEN